MNYRRLKAGGIPLHRCPIEQTYKGSSAHVFVLIASIYFGEVNLRYLHCFMTQCKGSIQPLPEGQRYNLPLDPNAIKRNQRRIHGNRDVGHDLNFYGSYLPIVWNLADDEYIKTVYGSMENIPAVFSQVPYEMFKLEQERFYAERHGRIIKFKRDDSEIFKIIEDGLKNLESQSNGLFL